MPKIRSAGFSYVEMLVATILIGIVLVPTLESLSGAIQIENYYTTSAIDHSSLIGKLEYVLAKSFEELEQQADTAGGPDVIVTSYSDPIGAQSRRIVYLARYDADNGDSDNNPFTGTDQGLLWVKAQIEGSSSVLQTLISR